jgi:phage terminase Nu1 subunit (DNA packaging protein)
LLIDISKEAKQKDFAKLIGVSASAVSGMVDKGVIHDGQTLGEWILAYCGHMREQAAGRASTGDLDLVTERAALARAQREKIEMQNEVTRGNQAPVMLLEEVLTKVASKIAGILDAIPGMVRRRIPGLKAEDIELITGEIAKARNTVATMSLQDLVDEESAKEDKSSDAATMASIGF